MRTYAGHSSAAESNALYRRNLAKGQTGLSVAFDLPTQTGYDPDHELARGEVGKVGVPVSHLGDIRALFDGIPLDRDEHLDDDQRHRDVAARALRGGRPRAGRGRAPTPGADDVRASSPARRRTTSSRSTSPAAPTRSRPAASMRLTTDLIAYTVAHMPRWNPINICSYHLQEAGATPVQEIAFALCTAIAVLDAVRDSGQVPPERFGDVVGRHLVLRQRRRAVRRGDVQDARVRRAVGRAHPRALRRRGRQAAPVPLRRAGQLARPHRGAAREQRAAHRARDARRHAVASDARARAVQLPAWNEALGLPRPWDQQWSLRIQQVLAFESDLLEYEDLFDGSHVVEAKVDRAVRGAPGPRWHAIEEMGGAVAAVESGYLKSASWSPRTRVAGPGSSRARRSWSGSTGSPRPSRTR